MTVKDDVLRDISAFDAIILGLVGIAHELREVVENGSEFDNGGERCFFVASLLMPDPGISMLSKEQL
jgi:hypothetical protein